MTNFERIKAMDVEELALFLNLVNKCEGDECQYCSYWQYDGCPCRYTEKWLELESKCTIKLNCEVTE